MKKSKKQSVSGPVGIKQESQDIAIDLIKLRNLDGLNKMLEEGSAEREFLDKYQSKTGKTALMVSCEELFIEGVRALLDAKANVSLRVQSDDGMTAFLLAARNGSTDIMDCLSLSGADINEKTQIKEETPLMITCRWGHIQAALFLISIECTLEDQNTQMETPLMIALKYEHFRICKELLEKKCNINLQGVNGNTALIRSAFDGRDATAAYILQSEGDVNIKNENGESAFIVACKHGHIKIVEMLLDRQSYVNDVDILGRTALMYAVINSKKEIIDLLVSDKVNVDVNKMDSYGYGALSFACLQREGIELVTTLLDAGAYVDAMDKSYSTPLMHACRKGNMQIAEYLVATGYADYSLANIDNMAPLDVIAIPEWQEDFRVIIANNPLSNRPLNYMKKNPGVKDVPNWVKRINAGGLLDIE